MDHHPRENVILTSDDYGPTVMEGGAVVGVDACDAHSDVG
jgi:hypothetical protein